MTLWVRSSPYVTGSGLTYQVRSDDVRGHLVTIGSGGDMTNIDGSLGETDDPTMPEWKRIDYAPATPPDTSTPMGKVKQRLVDLVASGNVFQIVGVPENTVWSDGRTTSVQPAYALGNTLFYAVSVCGGQGRWVKGQAGGEPCTPVVGILYHELAHSFRNHGAGDRATEEAEAITDENDLRAAMGLEPRSTTDLASGCGCPNGGCCIIASVATGAPYGPAIGRLRELRDHYLRATQVGSAFFDALHAEYYAFSIDVSRVLVQNEPARSVVEAGLVRPLIAVLSFLRSVSKEPDDDRLALEYRSLVQNCALARGDNRSLAAGLASLRRGAVPEFPAIGATPQVLEILAKHLPQLPHVQWALCVPLAMLLDSLALVDESDPSQVAVWWRRRLLDWLGDFPLAGVALKVDDQRWQSDLPELVSSAVSAETDRAWLMNHLNQRWASA